MLGASELTIIFLVVLLLFGASAIPKIARSLGQARSEFKKGINADQKESSDIQPEQKNDA